VTAELSASPSTPITVEIWSRTRARGSFQRQLMSPAGDLRYRAVLQHVAPAGGASEAQVVEYYMVARGRADQVRGGVGSAESPLLITIGPVEVSEAPLPWYSRWWVWTGIGAGAVTAAILIGVTYAAAVLTEEPGPPTTLGDHEV
jgi:hypothetical protein